MNDCRSDVSPVNNSDSGGFQSIGHTAKVSWEPASFEILQYRIYRNAPKFSDRQVWANSVDPDQTAPRSKSEEQSDQGLHCLQFPLHLLDALL